MNNLVFNTTANELRTAIYAQSGSDLQLVQLDGSNNLLVAGTVTVSEITNPVTIGNATLTVEGTVTVSEITNPITIGNATLTVEGTVTVSEITNPVTIANATLTVEGTVTIGASTFTSDAVTSTSVTGTGVIFADTDISTLKVASIFVYNEDTTPITISLQISPTTDTNLYVDDPSYTDQVIAANDSLYMAVSSFAHYIRLQYNLGAETATFSAYFNAQA